MTPIAFARARHRERGLTLVETLVSLAILMVTSVGSVSGFMLLNRYAADNRDRAAARALCQERIEQIMTMPFNAKNGNFPSVTGQDNNRYWLLGKSTDYDASINAYTGAANQQTSSTFNVNGEAVVIYKQPDGTAFVSGNRTTTISNAGTASLVRAVVTVTYTTRGKSNSCALYTLRGPD